ncbi:MAG: transposase [Sneathiellaceae bacterium]
MPRIYSSDLRERVVIAVEQEGLSRREAARRYRVSASAAVKWLDRYRRTGGCEAQPVGGDRRSRLPAHRDWILALVAAEPDLTLHKLAERLAATHEVRADAGMLSRFLPRHGISFKKKRAAQRAAARRSRPAASPLAAPSTRSRQAPADLPRR